MLRYVDVCACVCLSVRASAVRYVYLHACLFVGMIVLMHVCLWWTRVVRYVDVCVYVGLCVLMLAGMYTGMHVSSAHIRCGMCVCASMLVRPCVVIYIGMIVLMDACLWPTRVLRYVHVFVYVCV